MGNPYLVLHVPQLAAVSLHALPVFLHILCWCLPSLHSHTHTFTDTYFCIRAPNAVQSVTNVMPHCILNKLDQSEHDQQARSMQPPLCNTDLLHNQISVAGLCSMCLGSACHTCAKLGFGSSTIRMRCLANCHAFAA